MTTLPRCDMIQIRSWANEESMKTRWRVVGVTVLLGLCVVASIARKSGTSPAQTPAPTQATVSSSSQAPSLSIPDSTLAINSPAPMSQRVVHYEIEARYDAAKHTIDAT